MEDARSLPTPAVLKTAFLMSSDVWRYLPTIKNSKSLSANARLEVQGDARPRTGHSGVLSFLSCPSLSSELEFR